MISAPGYSKLITHVFRGGGEYLDSDVVFGVRDSLIADWTPQAPGTAPDGRHFETPWWLLEFDFVLSREG
jgi:hydroxyquinol 1,2-dioxygenase